MTRYLPVVTTLIVMLGIALGLRAAPLAAASDVGYRDFQFGSSCNKSAQRPSTDYSNRAELPSVAVVAVERDQALCFAVKSRFGQNTGT